MKSESEGQRSFSPVPVLAYVRSFLLLMAETRYPHGDHKNYYRYNAELAELITS